MKLTRKSSRWMRLGQIACLTVIMGTMCFCTNRPKTDTINTDDFTIEVPAEPIPFSYLDEKPLFNGQNANNFVSWVYTQLQLPDSWKENRPEGEMKLSFVVDTEGKVTDVKVLEGISEEIDAEIVRAVTSSPLWTPGKKDGKVVPAYFKLPVIFKNDAN